MTAREKIPVYAVISIFATAILSSSVAMTVYGSGSIVGNYAEGYELGKEYGAEDYREGYSADSTCLSNDSLSWCTGYKVGYEVG
jgi:hypothetical protein